MRAARRFVKDEAGMTMGPAVIMIVLLGVMGAGLLTFVGRDLNVVIEENRGQRAFEVADAGIGAAKQQLAANVNRGSYDGDGLPMEDPEPNCGTEASGESQWSALRCEDPDGLTLTNLDEDGATPDSVTITIEYMGEDSDEFLVISEGTYNGAKRRIEAIFHGLQAGAGGDGESVGHPLYYTPSSISVDGPNVQMDAISMFAGKDLLIEGVTDQHSFECEYTGDKKVNGINCTNDGTFAGFQGKKDSLCDWNSLNPLKGPASPNTGCYVKSSGPYNDYGRTFTNPNNGKTEPFVQPGSAAEGTICGFPSNGSSARRVGLNIPPGACTSASAADGVYGYDSTTENRGNHREFVAKDCSTPVGCPANLGNQISYPFPIFNPIAEGLRDAACHPPGTDAVCDPDDGKTPPPISYFEGDPNLTDSAWGLDTNEASEDRIAFVDAQNKTLTFSPDGGTYRGILVVWCGRLEMDAPFQGIIINIMGDELPDNTSCNNTTPGQEHVATYENLGYKCACWVYAEGGTATRAGIQIDPNSVLTFRPGEVWSFENGLFEGPPPTNFAIKSWRELYE